MDGTRCTPRARCGDVRECKVCARIRQARQADRAERGYAATGGHLTYAVVMPHHPGDTAAIRGAISKRLPARGGLWAVQVGLQTRGLHIDVVVAADAPLDATTIATQLAHPAEVWAQPIAPADLRNVVAYATRREAMPAREQYSGHLAGSWGGWRSVRQVMVEMAADPRLHVAPAPVRTEIVRAEMIRPDAPVIEQAAALDHLDVLRGMQRRELTDEDRAAAHIHLAALRQIIQTARP